MACRDLLPSGLPVANVHQLIFAALLRNQLRISRNRRSHPLIRHALQMLIPRTPCAGCADEQHNASTHRQPGLRDDGAKLDVQRTVNCLVKDAMADTSE